jgi:nucleoid-associated protein YgaU
MGQIERYGLYVLVLVIFMILIVAIWGEGPGAPQGGVGLPDVSNRVAAASRTSQADTGRRTVAGLDRDRQYQEAIDELFTRREPQTDPQQTREQPVPPVRERSEDLDELFSSDTDDSVENRGGTVLPSPGPVDGGREAVRPATRPYTIRDGDMLIRIARRELGSTKRIDEIRALNPGLDERRLIPGRTIQLPTGGAEGPVVGQQPQASGSVPGQHVVASGDTIEGIAKRYYGKNFGNKVREILELNPGVDPAKMSIGTTLRLPSAEVAAAR